ncbi:ThiF family adenylyltransferase [Peribacillus kribbensis]|uniref:ThiF family adenylyltransferase n=1 Tax=Peribacillus kribbensis TaxID=356658 RepID=UPI0004217F64|nr:ThiF family adenylyltransferase [Peribacillus kribbensis]
MNGRYSRQELFPPIGKAGQEKIQNSKVAIIGAGALGSASAEMLARAGVGHITIVDRDYVEWSNLQRQQLYTERDAEEQIPKAEAAKNRLKQINSGITIASKVMDIHGMNIEAVIKGHTVIVDASDNFETRLIVNDAAVKQGIPYIYGACVGSYGLTYPVIPGQTPCLQCLIDHLPAQGMTCDTAGVISPAVQTTAAYQVTSTLKVITGNSLEAVIQSFDMWNGQHTSIHARRLLNKNCPACGKDPSFPYLNYENLTKTAVLCGRDTVQIRPASHRDLSLEEVSLHLKEAAEKIKVTPYLVSFIYENHRIVLFKDGRALIHGTNDVSTAKGIYNRIVG